MRCTALSSCAVQTLLDVLNETIVDANLDEFVLLAVEELLPLSGPSEVAVNKTAATRDDAPMPAPPVPAGGSSPKPNGRRLLLTGRSPICVSEALSVYLQVDVARCISGTLLDMSSHKLGGRRLLLTGSFPIFAHVG